MFCPNCKAEYRPGFTKCSDCGVALVERMPEVQEIEPEDGVISGPFTVLETLDQSGAAQLYSFLEGHGIPAKLEGPSVVNPYDVGGAAGVVQILVPEDLAGPAHELLARVDRGELSIEGSTD